RLAFADWLEDRGNPSDADRAEFIRVQCRLARLAEGDSARPPLETHAEQLLAEHQQEWMQPLRAVLPSLPDQGVLFTRGVPSSITLNSGEELPYASQLAASAPLQELRLNLFNNRIADEGARALADSPHLQRLTHLDLFNNLIGNEGAQALAASPHL